jgi:hypothetical protein
VERDLVVTDIQALGLQVFDEHEHELAILMCVADEGRWHARKVMGPGGEPNARLAEAAAPAEGEGSQLGRPFGVEGHRPLAPAAVPGISKFYAVRLRAGRRAERPRTHVSSG